MFIELNIILHLNLVFFFIYKYFIFDVNVKVSTADSGCPVKFFHLFIPKFILLLSSFSESNTITIWNNGKGIPVVEHKDEKMYVPALIFGHLLTSSNYDDEQKKVTGDKITLKTRILIIVHLCNTISYGFDKASDRMSNLNHFYCLLL